MVQDDETVALACRAMKEASDCEGCLREILRAVDENQVPPDEMLKLAQYVSRLAKQTATQWHIVRIYNGTVCRARIRALIESQGGTQRRLLDRFYRWSWDGRGGRF